MEAIEILNHIENAYDEYFIDLHIINNSVVGFYKTHSIKYYNAKGMEESYLFPTTFIFNNGKIETSMVLGSVERNFKIPVNNEIENGSFNETNLVTSGVGYHLYKLLIAEQRLNHTPHDFGLINIKAFMLVIFGLDQIGFPFMRITNNKSLI